MRLLSLATVVIAVLAGTTWAIEDSTSMPFRPPIFAFQNGVTFQSLDEEVAALKEMGYAGVGSVGMGNLKERIQAYEKADLKVFSIYVDANNTGLPAAFELLKNRDAVIELTVRKGVDTATINRIQAIADDAAKANLRIAIYPHSGFAIATVSDALSLIKRVDRKNVGLNFNLCHFLKNEKASELEATIAKAGSRLFAASTCGADDDGNSWQTLIQPLDSGSFDQLRLLRSLEKIGFDGAVGLQCYAVAGDKRQNLERSIKAWNRLLVELAQ